MSYRDHLPEGFKGRAMLRGDLLPERLQRDALARYLHRFTREHVPVWARKPRKDGRRYPVQFASDAEWLARTLFPVTVRKDGTLGDHTLGTRGRCLSYATWPDGLDESDAARVTIAESVAPVMEGAA